MSLTVLLAICFIFSPCFIVAKKAKARTIIVKLLSTAGTGFFYTTRRPRTTPKLSFVKFDPRVNQNVLFNEAKINRPN
ncbi:54S ribosomal protein L39, mitochondrial [Linnemannia zychae]|nr:54S ribosomal protein L39, mitochondrial [Linnemannia zychae]